MSLSLADQYYLKALDNYPYHLEFALENLNYAMGFSDEHAGIASLMGLLYMEQFENLEMAEEYFQVALTLDHCPATVYSNYAELLMRLRRFEEAQKLIDYSLTVPGIEFSRMLHQKAMLFDRLKMYKKAKKILNEAIRESTCNGVLDYLKNEKKRIGE